MLNFERKEGFKYEKLVTTQMDIIDKMKETEAKQKQIAIVPFTLQVSTNSGTQSLKMTRELEGELSSTQLDLVKICLMKLNHLRHLTINFVCTNDLLEVVDKNCRKLTELIGCEPNGVSAEAIHWILPRNEVNVNEMCSSNGCDVLVLGCPDLRTLTMTDAIEMHIPFPFEILPKVAILYCHSL